MAGVYFIEFSSPVIGYNNYPVKIGLTNSANPMSRLRELSTGFPVKATNVRWLTFHHDYKYTPRQISVATLESHVHGLFSFARKHLEWFDISLKDVETLFYYWGDIASTQYYAEYLHTPEDRDTAQLHYNRVIEKQYHLHLVDLDRLRE